jgi:hypothetical protein
MFKTADPGDRSADATLELADQLSVMLGGKPNADAISIPPASPLPDATPVPPATPLPDALPRSETEWPKK